jgi:hypothetical protein
VEGFTGVGRGAPGLNRGTKYQRLLVSLVLLVVLEHLVTSELLVVKEQLVTLELLVVQEQLVIPELLVALESSPGW